MFDYRFDAKKSIYPRIAVLKAAYSFVENAYVHLDESENAWIVSLSPKNGSADVKTLAKEFENELLVQSVRLSVFQQTHVIRELLLARALSSTMVEDNGCVLDEPETDISQAELETILTDWFEK